MRQVQWKRRGNRVKKSGFIIVNVSESKHCASLRNVLDHSFLALQSWQAVIGFLLCIHIEFIVPLCLKVVLCQGDQLSKDVVWNPLWLVSHSSICLSIYKPWSECIILVHIGKRILSSFCSHAFSNMNCTFARWQCFICWKVCIQVPDACHCLLQRVPYVSLSG